MGEPIDNGMESHPKSSKLGIWHKACDTHSVLCNGCILSRDPDHGGWTTVKSKSSDEHAALDDTLHGCSSKAKDFRPVLILMNIPRTWSAAYEQTSNDRLFWEYARYLAEASKSVIDLHFRTRWKWTRNLPINIFNRDSRRKRQGIPIAIKSRFLWRTRSRGEKKAPVERFSDDVPSQEREPRKAKHDWRMR